MAQTLKNHKNESKHTFLFAAQPIMKLDWHDESRWLSLISVLNEFFSAGRPLLMWSVEWKPVNTIDNTNITGIRKATQYNQKYLRDSLA